MKNNLLEKIKKYMFVYIMILLLSIGNGITYYTQSRPLKLHTNLILLFLIILNFIQTKTKT